MFADTPDAVTPTSEFVTIPSGLPTELPLTNALPSAFANCSVNSLFISCSRLKTESSNSCSEMSTNAYNSCVGISSKPTA